jgi:hypothetical protein
MEERILQKPTVEGVRDEIKAKFDDEQRTRLDESALTSLIEKFPHNSDPAHVLLKVVAINRLYSTNIIAVHDVAACIVKYDIDSAVKSGALYLVVKLAPVTINGKVRRNISFASKYCNWHNQRDYPIYDSLARKSLLAYRGLYDFKRFSISDLDDYLKFSEHVADFRKHFDLDSLTFKELDKFLYTPKQKTC